MSGDTRQQMVDRLMLALTDLQNVSDQVDQAISSVLGLNRTDARCLSCLIIRGPMTAGDLAAAAGVAPTALTFAVGRLAQAGYVERTRDPADRRRVLVTATGRATRFAERMWSQTVTDSEQRLSRYSTQQLELLTGFVDEQIELQKRQVLRIRDGSGTSQEDH
ncbi:MarR family winged helix-turn-helix transcriptional regulator [Streptosporangium sp. V21-05]|uniref:MarR family winged helix-turn-helix transcriptional regulator n=1 Tax=Streptosporangium sp. V21-05 TaxID=3446115 RepID=UPI003F535D93